METQNLKDRVVQELKSWVEHVDTATRTEILRLRWIIRLYADATGCTYEEAFDAASKAVWEVLS